MNLLGALFFKIITKPAVLDAGFYSLLNFLLTIYLYSGQRYEELYAYGVCLTFALLAVSILRHSIGFGFIFNSNSVAEFLCGVFLLSVFSLGIGWGYVYFSRFDAFFLLVAVCLFNISHESVRVLCARRCVGGWLYLMPVSFIFISFSMFYGFLDLNFLSAVFLIHAFIEFLLISYFCLNSSRVDLKRIFDFSGFARVASQSSLVHGPFVLIPLLSGPLIVANLLLARSAFQGVQVLARAAELDMQNMFSNTNLDRVELLRVSVRKFALYGFFGGFFSCVLFFMVSGFFSLGGTAFPDFKLFVIWYFISLISSVVKPFDYFFCSVRKFDCITNSYFLAGLLLFFGVVAISLVVGDAGELNLSLIILCGWVICLASLFMKFKKIGLV